MQSRVMALAAAAVTLAAACGEEPAPAKLDTITRVKDGDTVELADGTDVRYLLVDTPEIAHNSTEVSSCFGEEAKALNEQLVLGKQVRLEYDVEKNDRYGRTLAYVWLGERMVNEILVERGYGCLCIIAPNTRYADEIRRLEAAAQAEGAGLWGACGVCEGACQ